jgi:hypothetical protein
VRVFELKRVFTKVAKLQGSEVNPKYFVLFLETLPCLVWIDSDKTSWPIYHLVRWERHFFF